MRAKALAAVWCALVVAAIAASSGWAAPKKKKDAPPPTPLTERGNELLAKYTTMLEELRAEIAGAIPAMDESKKADYLKARDAVKAAETDLAAAQKNRDKVKAAEALVGHAKGKWIGGADKGIAAAKEKLKNATTQAERDAAQAELAKWQKNREDGIKALKEREKALEEAKAEEPKMIKELDAAKAALAAARGRILEAIQKLGLKAFLESDALDARLAKYVVLSEATPRGLAEFAQQGEREEKLVEMLLADAALMKQMAVADGANARREKRSLGPAQYGPAMKIYTDIQKASTKAGTGALQRLALAVSLEHAVPVAQRNPESRTDAPATVDPVKRYLHYEKACLGGELDAGFKGLSVWDYRFVVNGNEPDEILAWGRQMLRNYRPDHITTSDYRWRYVAAVKTEVRYGSQDNKYDKPELQFFQNILMNGGVCGRRAFFGRFILRAFGVPTTARPQPGHAALAHWTPDGWVVCLGAAWGKGSTGTRYRKDLDFLANTQARACGKSFLQVKRAQWIGLVMGEEPVYGLNGGDPAFWHCVALYCQQAIIEEAKAVALAAVGEDIGEANESKEKEKVEAATLSEQDRRIVVGENGAITIPAAACSKPTNSTGKIKFMPSNQGGMQLHYGRLGGDEEFEYTFEAPAAGKYKLVAKVVTPSWKQHLFVVANGAGKPVDIALPFTVGMWDETKPVDIALVEGRNVLTFSRKHEGLKGVTIREFKLTPVRN